MWVSGPREASILSPTMVQNNQATPSKEASKGNGLLEPNKDNDEETYNL